jgi:hypothetical protein
VIYLLNLIRIYKKQSIKKMGNICGAAPSKDNQDQPIDHKSSKQPRGVSINR